MEQSDIASLKGCPKGGRGGGQQTFIKLLDPDTKGKAKQLHPGTLGGTGALRGEWLGSYRDR